MITYLKVNGFKNLINCEIHFGAFTCIAGANAIGKSNLFDAIQFIGYLSHNSLLESASKLRDGNTKGIRSTDIKDIFYKFGEKHSPKMSFYLEMLIPKESQDHLGIKAEASITSVSYELELSYREEDNQIQIEKEELKRIPVAGMKEKIKFTDNSEWKNSVILGNRKVDFISTEEELIKLHQDQRKGKPLDTIKSNLPKTVLSSVDSQYPTALVVKNEMASWQLLQLEPSALRKPDDFLYTANAKLTENGEHLAATLYRLQNKSSGTKPQGDVYQTIANKLADIIENIDTLTVDKDEKRRELTLVLTQKDGTQLPARALSDGTLRFLGLAVLEQEVENTGLICMEEPENGIHPGKIENIIELLKDISVDTEMAVEDTNPLRQVIINTHSTVVVKSVDEDSLLLGKLIEKSLADGTTGKTIDFKTLEGTWREKTNSSPISLNEIIYYLNPNTPITDYPKDKKRVKDREDIKTIQKKIWE